MSATRVFLLTGGVKRDPAIAVWMREQPPDLRKIAQQWFGVMRACGDDVRELVHDDQATACIGEAAFAYVDAFTAHVNVGFFNGSSLDDPKGLLQGAGKFMRHVKLKPGDDVDSEALHALIRASYADMKRAVRSQGPHG